MSGSQLAYLATGVVAYSKIHDPVVESGGEGDLVELDVFGFGLQVSFVWVTIGRSCIPS